MESTGYTAIHERLRTHRGRASSHPCSESGCDQAAHHWAWQHTGPSRTGTVGGRTITWGTRLEDYAPLCRRHHAIFDGPATVEAYACGHPRDHRKDCRVCRTERQRLARAS